MSLPHYFDIGVDAADYVAPYPVTYSNWDLFEGLPDEELVCPDGPECTLRRLPEECPEMIVIDEADYDE